MPQWKKWWLLFSVIWVAVTAIQAVLILATSEEPEKAVQPIVLGIAVPAVLYLIGWLISRLRQRRAK